MYSAGFLHDQPEKLLESLLDGLSANRIEIDLIEFIGEAFATVDNRVMVPPAVAATIKSRQQFGYR